METAPDALIVTRRQGKIALVNTQTEELFGYKREELFGQTIEMLMPEAPAGGGIPSIGPTTTFIRPGGRWAGTWNCSACARTEPSFPSKSASARS